MNDDIDLIGMIEKNIIAFDGVSRFSHPGLRNVFLCHLSENNNTPDEAHRCTREALDAIGRRDVRLVVLPRQLPSRLFHL